MPVFYFRARGGGADLLTDDESVELPDVTAATAYATEVAREIMRADEVRKRLWLLEVVDGGGNIVAKVPFAAVDPTLDHLDSELRGAVEIMLATCRIIRETQSRSKSFAAHIRATRASLERKPYLIALNGQRL